jgi:cytochrome c553
MKNNYLKFLLLLFLVISCENNKKEIIEKQSFDMYEYSELALLMEEFYVYNDSLKSQIVNGKVLSSLPVNFNELHTAKMTDRFERDESFQLFATLFEKHQKAVYEVSKDSLKEAFNATIHTCIACHKTTCTGPIPRIQKLLIK